jgi:hypothetical protein
VNNVNKIRNWSIAGAFALIFGGSLIHFAYELSGFNPFVAFFASVNESVWEHLKLGFTSLLLFSLVEYWFVRRDVKNYIIAKSAGILALQLFIILFFYGYNLFLEENLILDIISYVIGCILCQIVIYRIYIAGKLPAYLTILCSLFLLAHLAVLMYFTFYPPKLGIFLEDHSGRYGTEWEFEGEENHEH